MAATDPPPTAPWKTGHTTGRFPTATTGCGGNPSRTTAPLAWSRVLEHTHAPTPGVAGFQVFLRGRFWVFGDIHDDELEGRRVQRRQVGGRAGEQVGLRQRAKHAPKAQDSLLGVPPLDASRRGLVLRELRRAGAIDLRDEGCRSSHQKPLDLAPGGHEGSGQVGVRGLSDDDQQPDAVAYHGIAFVDLVADLLVVSDADPALPPDLGEPLLVRAVGGK